MWRLDPGWAGNAPRTAAGLFLLAGVLALAGIAAPGSRQRDLVVVAIADALVTAAALWLPWHRMHPRATLSLAVAGLAVLAFATWAFGGVATGTGPFFILLFAWVGLHHPAWAALLLMPLTAAAYVAPLVVSHQPAEVIGSAVVFVPVTTAVAAVIAGRVRQLQLARAEVEAAEQWRASLMVTLAHDVRSPLTSVQMVLGILADEDSADLTAEERKRLTDSALRQADRITRLAGGLLDISRVENGALRLDRRAVGVRAAAERAAGFMPASAGVRVDVDPGLAVEADPERLEQMLVNLMGNAARHGAAPIVVGAEAAGPDVRIEVRDHGPGVPEAAEGALFGRFAAGGAQPGSVGLGLWIVHEFARAQGGDAWYEPADPGARFVISLPAATADPQ
jgi:signal transduction histidine kinase